MLVVGLTGGIGSGKTTVTRLFAEKGVMIIDADQLARDLTQPGMPVLKQIAELIDNDVFLPNGSLDRPKLRKIVFADKEKRLRLEKLLHPLIRTEMKRQIETTNSPYCLVVIPLLFETEPNPLIQRILLVDAPEELQISRTMARDNAPMEDVIAILKTQANREKRLALANDVIHNQGSFEDLIHQVDNMHELYLSLDKTLR